MKRNVKTHYVKRISQKLPETPLKFLEDGTLCQHSKEVIGAGKLFNLIITKFNLRNDAHLSEFLGCAPPVVSKIRNGKVPIGNPLLVRIHEEMAIPVRELRTIIAAG
jgi:hypothetical protein